MSDEASHENNPASDFETRVAGVNPGLVLDIGGLLLQNKKWWLLPIFIAFGTVLRPPDLR
jgi:hypothetical protein